MKISMYQVDAFAERVFEGNPAAVCPLEEWLPDETLQSIAQENNLSETAFFVKEGESYHLRWFTPVVEVDLCGHATLASAHVIFEKIDKNKNEIEFRSRSGELRVFKQEEYIQLDFPAAEIQQCEIPLEITNAFGKEPKEVWKSDDYIAVYENESDVIMLSPDFSALSELDCRGIIATAPGSSEDFVSRAFFPRCGVNEDPVTGSAHCELMPYWVNELGSSKLSAAQLSKRGGKLQCVLDNDRVLISGKAVSYFEGIIRI